MYSETCRRATAAAPTNEFPEVISPLASVSGSFLPGIRLLRFIKRVPERKSEMSNELNESSQPEKEACEVGQISELIDAARGMAAIAERDKPMWTDRCIEAEVKRLRIEACCQTSLMLKATELLIAEQKRTNELLEALLSKGDCAAIALTVSASTLESLETRRFAASELPLTERLQAPLPEQTSTRTEGSGLPPPSSEADS